MAEIEASLEPRAVGAVSIVGGTCSISSRIEFSVSVPFSVNLIDGMSRPVIDIRHVLVDPSIHELDISGWVLALYTMLPMPRDCSAMLGDDIRDGLVELVDEKVSAIEEGNDQNGGRAVVYQSPARDR